MTARPVKLAVNSLLWLLLGSALPLRAGITSVVETGLAPDPAAVISPAFDEDILSYNNRTHQHNGAAFDEFTGLLNINGTTITGLPSYLIGNDYVRFANDARDNAGYSALITADTPSTFYLLIDNRLNGPAAALKGDVTTDPVLGGTLQWVIDGGWQRMNTGISPNGQPDYTAIDESGDGVGPGGGVNNFMAVYKFPAISTSVTISNGRIGGGGNMMAVVAVPTAPPPVPIVGFSSNTLNILPGGAAQLSWLISPTATTATIDPGVGNIISLTDGAGSGTAAVTPVVNTTYTLSVNTPTGNATQAVSVSVLPLASFTANRQRIDAGESVVLNWRVRPDAVVTIDGIGSVNAATNAAGVGTRTVQPTENRDYILRATADGITSTATLGVVIRPAGQAFALIDIGATGGRAEPGAANSLTLGAGADGANGLNLPSTPLLSDTGVQFTLGIDNLNPDGNPVGQIDWRDRGDSPDFPLNRLSEDFVKNNGGLIRVTLGQLPAGTYDVVSYHLDAAFSQTDQIRILVTDANGVATDTNVMGNASWPDHPANTGAPTIPGLTTGLINSRLARFTLKANGTDDVLIYFDSSATPVDTELPLSGLQLSMIPPRPVDPTWALIDIGASSGQAEPGAADHITVGNANAANSLNLAPAALMSRTGVNFQLSLDNMDPLGNPVGGLDWRDRGDAPDVPLGWMAEDFVKNNAGLIRATLTGLPAGKWLIRSYHLDPTASQSALIRVLVTDASRTAADTLVVADSSFPTGDPGAPQLNGLYPGLIGARSALVEVTSNGTDNVILYFDSTQDGADTELPLSGIRITPAPTASEIIPITSIVHTVNSATASVAVSFVSKADQTYTVYASADPANWGVPLTTTLPATGVSTLFTETNIPLSTPRRFYLIRRN